MVSIVPVITAHCCLYPVIEPAQVVEDSVLSSGGEVVRRERELRASLHESLRMTVAIPWLFGVPPAYEMLRYRK